MFEMFKRNKFIKILKHKTRRKTDSVRAEYNTSHCIQPSVHLNQAPTNRLQMGLHIISAVISAKL